MVLPVASVELVPQTKLTVVDELSAFTVPLSVAAVAEMEEAAEVEAVGALATATVPAEAFDVVVSLNAFKRPVVGTCGPTQKSTKVSRSLMV